jgi:hypothetical protein
LQLYTKDLFGAPVRLETDSGKPRCRHAVPWATGNALRPGGFDQCKRAGQVTVDGVWLCNAHNPTAAIARRRAAAAKLETQRTRERLMFAAPRMKAALTAIRAGAKDPAAVAAKALEGLE